jgi:hypothetical protein
MTRHNELEFVACHEHLIIDIFHLLETLKCIAIKINADAEQTFCI